MRLPALIFGSALLVLAGDGIPARAKASDYPVHQPAAHATLAAVRVPPRQIEKMFSPEIARQYVVLEVALYPESEFDIDWFDFNLKIGNTIAHVEKPLDVTTPWPEKTPQPSLPVTVLTETGVAISHTSDPVYGRHTDVGTYESVGVTNDPRAAAPPPPPPGPDPVVLARRVRERVLPEGPARSAVAGYLFFPQYKRQKNAPLELRWSKDNDSATLRIPEK